MNAPPTNQSTSISIYLTIHLSMLSGAVRPERTPVQRRRRAVPQGHERDGCVDAASVQQGGPCPSQSSRLHHTTPQHARQSSRHRYLCSQTKTHTAHTSVHDRDSQRYHQKPQKQRGRDKNSTRDSHESPRNESNGE